MESIYYVLCRQGHGHCYEDQFRPYYGAELEKVVGDARAAFSQGHSQPATAFDVSGS